MTEETLEIGELEIGESVEKVTKKKTLQFPSVYNGDVPFLTFYDGEKIVGKLWGKGGVLSIEGDAEESAKVFFEEVIRLNKHLLEPPT